jgi:hypothetical protein
MDLWLEHRWMVEHLPQLFQLLSLPEVEGKPREPASIRLFVQDGRLKAAINDPSSGMVWFATLDAEMAPLDALEAHFGGDLGEWREQKDKKDKRTW